MVRDGSVVGTPHRSRLRDGRTRSARPARRGPNHECPIPLACTREREAEMPPDRKDDCRSRVATTEGVGPVRLPDAVCDRRAWLGGALAAGMGAPGLARGP